jgi:hypothetical protein
VDVRHARQTAKAWIEANLERWPGLRAAHLVGGITAMPEDAPFPAWKDVDIHLIFDDGSPDLQPRGPFANIIEEAYRGLLIEAGIKSVADYRSAEAVLANPEIAYHLTVDCGLYDPDGFLRDLQAQVKREYAQERWVLARIEHERQGFQGALGMRPMVAAAFGASGEMMILGYSQTFLAAVLQVAALNPPRMGGQSLVRLNESLAAEGRPDLFEGYLGVLGLRDADRLQAEALLDEAVEAFNLAVVFRKSPHPFEHKLHAHLRPYFVESSKAMIAAGHHREALAWITAFLCGSIDVILADGPEAEKLRCLARQSELLRQFGMDDPTAMVTRFVEAHRLGDEIFALAEKIAARQALVAA